MSEPELRDYQTKAVSLVRESIVSGHKRPLIVIPTGGGKTLVFGKIISLACKKGKTCLFIVHRRNLVIQFKESLKKFFGIEAGVIMAGIEFVPGCQVYVTTIQTYSRRMDLGDLYLNRFWINADVVLVDEGHVCISDRFKKVLNCYSDKIIVGCTATPCRGDGSGLGAVFDALVDVISMSALVESGFLAPMRYFAAPMPDLSGVKTRMGDYEKKGLAEKTDQPKIVGDVVENWLRYGENRKTLVFAVNVKHSIHLRDEFVKAGVPAEHLDARSSDEERERVLGLLKTGEIRVAVNVALYQEGMNIPSIGCVVMARPTKSLGLYRQCCGRGMRVTDEYENCILLDHGGNIERLGFLTDEVEWTLEGKELAKKKNPEKKEKKPVICRSCTEVFEGVSVCPRCGTEVKSFGKEVKTKEAALAEITPKKRNKITDFTEKRAMLGVFKYYASSKGYSQGWASHAYRDLFGVWPNSPKVKSVGMVKPYGKFESMLKHVLIKKAKAYRGVA